MYSKKNSNTELHPKTVKPMWHIQGLFLDQGELWTCVKSPTVKISISEPAPSLQLFFFFSLKGENSFLTHEVCCSSLVLFSSRTGCAHLGFCAPHSTLAPSPAVSIAQVWCRKQQRLPVPRLHFRSSLRLTMGLVVGHADLRFSLFFGLLLPCRVRVHPDNNPNSTDQASLRTVLELLYLAYVVSHGWHFADISKLKPKIMGYKFLKVSLWIT